MGSLTSIAVRSGLRRFPEVRQGSPWSGTVIHSSLRFSEAFWVFGGSLRFAEVHAVRQSARRFLEGSLSFSMFLSAGSIRL